MVFKKKNGILKFGPHSALDMIVVNNLQKELGFGKQFGRNSKLAENFFP